MKRKFKVGEIVKRFKGGGYSNSEGFMREGKEYTLTNVYEDGDVKVEGSNSYYYGSNFKLVEGSKKQLKPTTKHIVLEDGCNNLIGSIMDSFQEAVDNFTPRKDETYTIYELIPISKVELSKKVTKIRTTKITKRKKKK